MSSSFIPRRSSRLAALAAKADGPKPTLSLSERLDALRNGTSTPANTVVYDGAATVPVSVVPSPAVCTTPPRVTRAEVPDAPRKPAPPVHNCNKPEHPYPLCTTDDDIGYIACGDLVMLSDLVVGKYYYVGKNFASARRGKLVELGRIMAAVEFRDSEPVGFPVASTHFFEVDNYEPAHILKADRIEVGDFVFASRPYLDSDKEHSDKKPWFGRVTDISWDTITVGHVFTFPKNTAKFRYAQRIRPVVPNPRDNYILATQELLQFTDYLDTHKEYAVKNSVVITLLAYGLLCYKPEYNHMTAEYYVVLRAKVDEACRKFGEDDPQCKALRRYFNAIVKPTGVA